MSILIEKGIPLPAKRDRAHAPYWKLMQVGDSAVVTPEEANRAFCSCKRYGLRFRQQKQPHGKVRLWRVA